MKLYPLLLIMPLALGACSQDSDTTSSVVTEEKGMMDTMKDMGSNAMDKAGEMKDKAVDGTKNVYDSAKEKGGDMMDKAGEMKDKAVDGTKDMYDAAKDKAVEMKDKAVDGTKGMIDSAKEKGSSMMGSDSVSDQAADVMDAVEDAKGSSASMMDTLKK